jgi:hypothetical protein
VSEPYNRFTGQSLEHLTALSDGLFAVAMTLLVLDLRVPVGAAGTAYSEHGLAAATGRPAPGWPPSGAGSCSRRPCTRSRP